MSEQTFTKRLTANDSGETGAHQAGIHVPKGEKELIAFLPFLNGRTKNPDAWISCVDEGGEQWSFRFVFYNNKHHDMKGTRDEYRITHMTQYFKTVGAKEGDVFQITGELRGPNYKICVKSNLDQGLLDGRIKLKGWRRAH